MFVNKWDVRGLEIAFTVAKWSKDPSTQVGACIMRPDNTIASFGFNGFPRGIKDDDRLNNREQKYELVVHAELNAILTAREPLNDYTLYCSLMTCCRCAVHVLQTGIARVVAPVPDNERWRESIENALLIYKEAGVATSLIPRSELGFLHAKE